MLADLDADMLLRGALGRWLREQEVPRREAVSKSNKRFLIGGLVSAALLYLIWRAMIAGAMFWFLAFPFVIMVPMVWAYWPRFKAQQAVKTGVNEAIAEAVGISYTMEGNASAPYFLLKSHDMLPAHNQRSFEDFWQGEVAGQPFQLCEAHLIQRSKNSKGQSSTTTKFRGPFMTIGCAQELAGTTILQRAGTHKRFLFFGGKKDQITAAGKTLNAVDMVHPEFEDAFDVYSTDQVEARMLIHPRYIERLIEIERAFQGKKVRAIFCDDVVTIMLSSKNLFESGTLDAGKDREKVAQTIEQFRSLANLAITLNRN